MPMLEEKSRAAAAPSLALPSKSERKQRQQMLVALALLLAALILVLYKDWQFWFPSPESAQDITPAERTSGPVNPAPVQVAKTQLPLPEKVRPVERAKAASPREKPPEAPGPIVTSRAVLPPLD